MKSIKIKSSLYYFYFHLITTGPLLLVLPAPYLRAQVVPVTTALGTAGDSPSIQKDQLPPALDMGEDKGKDKDEDKEINPTPFSDNNSEEEDATDSPHSPFVVVPNVVPTSPKVAEDTTAINATEPTSSVAKSGGFFSSPFAISTSLSFKKAGDFFSSTLARVKEGMMPRELTPIEITAHKFPTLSFKDSLDPIDPITGKKQDIYELAIAKNPLILPELDFPIDEQVKRDFFRMSLDVKVVVNSDHGHAKVKRKIFSYYSKMKKDDAGIPQNMAYMNDTVLVPEPTEGSFLAVAIYNILYKEFLSNPDILSILQSLPLEEQTLLKKTISQNLTKALSSRVQTYDPPFLEKIVNYFLYEGSGEVPKRIANSVVHASFIVNGETLILKNSVDYELNDYLDQPGLVTCEKIDLGILQATRELRMNILSGDHKHETYLIKRKK